MARFLDANMVEYSPSSCLSTNDVLLMPQYSDFNSRNDSRISTESQLFTQLFMDTPLISASMDTITGPEMAIKLSELGGIGFLHRFFSSDEERFQAIQQVTDKVGFCIFSIGVAKEELNFVKDVINRLGAEKIALNIDIAHGDSQLMINQIQRCKKQFPCRIIAGNVATIQGVVDLVSAGADAIKIGVGCGSLCTTRLVTGHGYPQLSAVMAARRAISGSKNNCKIIADGGIRNSGDIVKLIAAGADTVMVGRLFAGTTECPGPYFNRAGDVVENLSNEHDISSWYKLYRGQSSQHFLDSIGKTNVASEGEDMKVPYKGTVENVFKELVAGVRSGLTYSGAANFRELWNKAVFMEITNHGYVEGTPHAKFGY